MRCRVPQTLDVRHLRAHLGSFAIFLHLLGVKLTTKNTKDTENFASLFRAAVRVHSGERRQAADGCRLAACAPRKQKPTLHKTRRLFLITLRIIVDDAISVDCGAVDL